MIKFAVLTIASITLSQSPAMAPRFAKVLLHAPKAALTMEVADTPGKREYGLMNRFFLGRHDGMVFVFTRNMAQEFWMKNTLIPLDMVFVDGNGRVSSVAQNVPASRLDTADADIARRRGLAKFVLELNAGEAARDGLTAGALVTGLTALKALDR
ncbi:MAG: DUF192 domain-containing protein [Candidatus Eremiobacteraeota bacterium]|nr:DUF192 domain-containing protein [Candidatus Eremiobacteraeota bacterium]